ncbi:type II toxin-antitoxin system RelE/ParE family toxin [Lacinutrix sp. MEBiC02595]
MALKVIIKPEAELDIQDAINWYNEQKDDLDFELLTEIILVIDLVRENPNYFQKRYKDFRISFTKRFKYGIHYTVENKTIYIHAVLHMNQEPKE